MTGLRISLGTTPPRAAQYLWGLQKSAKAISEKPEVRGEAGRP